jgi:hypothetical protein
MQGTDEARRTQAPFAHPGMSVCADVVECKQSFARVADHDLAVFQKSCLHSSLGNLGQGHQWDEWAIGHDLPRRSKDNLGLEDGYRLADDPHGLHTAVLEFQFDIHSSRAMQ